MVLGVNSRLKILSKGVGANAFVNSTAHGFVVALQSDFKRYAVYFTITTGTGSSNVVFRKNERIAGDLAAATNANGTWAINNYDEGTSYTIYYIPIE